MTYLTATGGTGALVSPRAFTIDTAQIPLDTQNPTEPIAGTMQLSMWYLDAGT
jgi:hypothetical protein